MSEPFQYDVFLSHSSNDKLVVRDVAERLKKDGLRVWFDEWEIRPGDSIPSKIEEGLERSRVLVLCMSANAFGSDWAQLESGTFRFRDPLNKERRFLPLRLDDAPIKGSLAQFLYIEWQPAMRAKEYGRLRKFCSLHISSPIESERPLQAGTKAPVRESEAAGIPLLPDRLLVGLQEDSLHFMNELKFLLLFFPKPQLMLARYDGIYLDEEAFENLQLGRPARTSIWHGMTDKEGIKHAANFEHEEWPDIFKNCEPIFQTLNLEETDNKNHRDNVVYTGGSIGEKIAEALGKR